ncbi:MAG: aminopeptidase P N-terminal domain-containing protein [Candidatus Kapaibacterium sp.]
MSRPVSLLLLLSLLTIVPASLTRAQEAGVYEHFNVYDGDNFPRTEYANRRKQTLEKLKSGEGMLLRSAEVRNRSNDVDYEFRQRNNLLYLTGVTETESALLLIPDGIEVDGKRVTEILFVAERNPAHEIWEGIRMGPKVAAQVTGITTVLPYDELAKILEDLFPTFEKLYYDNWTIGSIVDPVAGVDVAWPAMVRDLLESKEFDLEVEDAGEVLNGMRAIKSEREIATMQKAIDISAEGHREAMRMAKPGMFEYEFEASMEYTFRRLGAEDPGYPSIVGSGPNTCILHYNTNRRKSLDGELILMDCGAEYHGYSADITRTFPVNGKFTPEQRAIYNLVLEAQTEAIKECKVGAQFWDPHKEVGRVISSGLVKLGIMKEGDDVQKYFMHGTSHFLGMDVHDVGEDYTLQPGMVLTVEPGIYIPEGSKCDPKWWNIGIRIEDNVLVTKNGPVNLSAGLERTVEEIEGLVGSGRK